MKFAELTIHVTIMQRGVSGNFGSETVTIHNQTAGRAVRQAVNKVLAGRKDPFYGHGLITGAK